MAGNAATRTASGGSSDVPSGRRKSAVTVRNNGASGGEAEELSYGFAEDNDQDHDKPACPCEYARIGLCGGALRVQAQEWCE